MNYLLNKVKQVSCKEYFYNFLKEERYKIITKNRCDGRNKFIIFLFC